MYLYPCPQPLYPCAYGAPPAQAPLQMSEAETPPDEEGQFAPRHRRANTGKAGKILVGVGLGVAALGGIILGVSAGASASRGGSGYGQLATTVVPAFGGILLGAGGVSILVGIPLWAAAPSRP